jgi:hypothetical protein
MRRRGSVPVHRTERSELAATTGTVIRADRLLREVRQRCSHRLPAPVKHHVAIKTVMVADINQSLKSRPPSISQPLHSQQTDSNSFTFSSRTK